MYTVGSAEVARRAVDAGVDIIVAQGWEAGGHERGEVATMALLPRVVDAVLPGPVISAGSIADGRGIAAALMLGADGVWVDTQFAASEEADIALSDKRRILQATETDTLLCSLYNVGREAPGRALCNGAIGKWEAAGRPAAGQRPDEGEVIAQDADGTPLVRYSSIGSYKGVPGNLEGLCNWAGQGVGLVDHIQSAAEIVSSLAEDATSVLLRTSSLIQPDLPESM